MKIIYSFLLTAIFIILSISDLYGVKATPYPINVMQPDGTELTIYLRGNEFFHYKTTLDGYVLTTDSKGILTYADIDSSGNLINTHIKASNIEKRSYKEREILLKLKPNIYFNKNIQHKRALRVRSANTKTSVQTSYPLTGNPKSLVILVNFSDVSFVTPQPQTSFTNLLNQKGYSANNGTGSAKDYFRDNSMGVFNPQFDVVGPFNLQNTMAFYGANKSDGDDTNPQQMVIDACSLASTSGVDFSQYDTDHDGTVDNVFIYFAGYNEAEGGSTNSIWPHRWSLANHNTKFSGVAIFDYACTSELRGKSGTNMCGIGTFCHEFGHVLGLDDMYVTSSSIADHYTLSFWDIMDSGTYLNDGKTPPSYSSYERFYLNWLKPIELKVPQQVTLDTLTTSNKAYLISQNANHNLIGSNPNPVEFFLLENRQNTGWDTYIGKYKNYPAGHGMLITHIFYNPSTWADNGPNNDPLAMGVDIVEADGIGSDVTLPGDPFPGTSNKTIFSPILRSGTNINKPLTYIAEKNGIITFRFMGGGNIPTISTTGTLTIFSTVQGTPSTIQTIIVNGIRLVSDIQLSFEAGLHFEMRKAGDTNWSKTITLVQTDSIVNNVSIQIRYNPTEPSFKFTHLDKLKLNATLATTDTINLSGVSTRPVFIKMPIATSATDIKLESFVANWHPVTNPILGSTDVSG